MTTAFPIMPGRTIILTQLKDSPLDFVKNELPGFESSHATPNGTEFYMFNTVANATLALDALVDKGYAPRYAYYRLFAKFTPPQQASTPESLDSVKQQVEQTIITHHPSVNILYSRLHPPSKGTYTVRNGVLTLDRLEDLQQLVNKSYGLFQLYRYRVTKPKFPKSQP